VIIVVEVIIVVVVMVVVVVVVMVVMVVVVVVVVMVAVVARRGMYVCVCVRPCVCVGGGSVRVWWYTAPARTGKAVVRIA
jgi:hypothetical protein